MYHSWTAQGGGGAYGGGGGGSWSGTDFIYGGYGGWGSNSGNGNEAATFILERYVGTALVSRSQLTLYPSQAQVLFYEAIRQIAGQSPQGIKLIWYDYIYDQIEGVQKSIENSAEAWNFHRDDWDLA